MTSVDHLVYMVNQIARNFAIDGDEAATRATTDHLEKFWDPRMKQLIMAQGAGGLSPVAAAAVAALSLKAHS